MKKSIVFIILLCTQLMTAQIKVYNETEYQSKPYFPGGWNEYFSFVERNFKWVNEKNAKHIKLDLTVQADGKLTDAKITDPNGSSNEKEALRVVELMPKWVPATKSDKKVSCKLSLGMFNPYFSDSDGGMGALTIAVNPNASSTFPSVNSEDNNIYNTAGIEVKPEFLGGIEKFYQFFNTNFKMPDEEDLKGKVFATFIVEKDGSLSEIKILRDIGYGIGQEVLRVLRLSPKWMPGMQNAKIIRVMYSMPFTIETVKK